MAWKRLYSAYSQVQIHFTTEHLGSRFIDLFESFYYQKFKPIGRGQYPLFHLAKSAQQSIAVDFSEKIRIINQSGQLKGAVTLTTSSLDKNELAQVNCIIVLGDEALSPEDEGIATYCSDENLNERFVEGNLSFIMILNEVVLLSKELKLRRLLP